MQKQQGSYTFTLGSGAKRALGGMLLIAILMVQAWTRAQTFTGFTVQFCTNLALGEWLNVTSPAPQMVSNQWQISLPPSTNADSIFYRLVK